MNKLNRRHFLKSAFAAALMLGTHRAYAQKTTNIIYVDSTAGDDANNGLSPADSMLTLDGARRAVEALGGVGTIRVYAPATNPVQGYVEFASGKITIESADGISAWYCERGATTIPSGSAWTDRGDGVFSQPLAESSGTMWVSMLDRLGFLSKLTVNVELPTSPEVGQIGYSDGLIFVHLPGGINPADFTFKRNGISYLVRVSGSADVTIRSAIFRYAVGNAVELASANARVVSEACAAQYSGIGFGDSAAGAFVCEGCFGQRNMRGFNIRFSTALLQACDGSYNDEVGAISSDTANLTIQEGRYHHNGIGGVMAINEAIMDLTNVEADHNGQSGNGQLVRGGIHYAQTTSGSITDCNTHDNIGEGFYCASEGEIVITSLTSTNNTLDDVLCSS